MVVGGFPHDNDNDDTYMTPLGRSLGLRKCELNRDVTDPQKNRRVGRTDSCTAFSCSHVAYGGDDTSAGTFGLEVSS